MQSETSFEIVRAIALLLDAGYSVELGPWESLPSATVRRAQPSGFGRACTTVAGAEARPYSTTFQAALALEIHREVRLAMLPAACDWCGDAPCMRGCTDERLGMAEVAE